MARIAGCWMLAGICWLPIGQGSSAQEAAPLKELAKLNNVTGTAPAQDRLKAIMADKEAAKRLVDAGLPLTKEKEKLSYNAALILALVAADLKDMPATEAYFRVCIQQAIKLNSVTKTYQSLIGLVEVFYENKKYDESARLCQEFLKFEDDGKERTIVRVIRNPRTGDAEFDEGEDVNTVKRIESLVFRQLVQALAKQKKFDQAYKIVDNLIKQSDDWRDRQLKGILLRDEGKIEDAIKVYEELIDQVKNDRRMDKAQRKLVVERNQYIMSNLFVDLKQIDKATEVLQDLLKANPNDPGYNNDLGYIWADHDMNLDEAEQLIRKALDEDRKQRKADPDLIPEDDRDKGAYLDSLGWVLFKKKDYKEAKKVMLEAVEDKNAKHIEIYDHLGDILIQLNETEGALKAWEDGLKHVTDSRRDQERKKLVEEKVKKPSAK